MKQDRKQVVHQFKQFLSEHPRLVEEIRQKKRTLQEVFEEYILLGEEDPSWELYKKTKPDRKKEKNDTSSSSKLLASILSNINLDNIDKHMEQADKIIGGVIQMIEQYQKENTEDTNTSTHSFIPRD